MWKLSYLKTAQTTGERIVLDGAVALFVALIVGFILASLSAAGIITMVLASILLVLAWVFAMIGTFLMTHIWNPSHKHRALFGGVLALFLFCIGAFEYKSQPAHAQTITPGYPPPTPSSTQVCQPGAACSQGQTGGQNVGTLNRYGPRRLPNQIYQGDQSIAHVQGWKIADDEKNLELVNPHFDGFIDPNTSFEFQDFEISCPQILEILKPTEQHIAIGGLVRCDILSKLGVLKHRQSAPLLIPAPPQPPGKT